MKFGMKWSELSDKQKDKAKEEYGSKQGWQDAKAKAQANKGGSSSGGAKRYELPWNKLTPEQQAKSGSREEHKAKRQELGYLPAPNTNKPPSSSSGSSSGSFFPDAEFEGPKLPAPTQKWSELSDQEKETAKLQYGSKQGYKETKKSGEASIGAVGQDPYKAPAAPSGPKAPSSDIENYPMQFFDNYGTEEAPSSSTSSGGFTGAGGGLGRFDPFGYMSGLTGSNSNRFGSKAKATGMFNQAHDFTSDQRLKK